MKGLKVTSQFKKDLKIVRLAQLHQLFVQPLVGNGHDAIDFLSLQQMKSRAFRL